MIIVVYGEVFMFLAAAAFVGGFLFAGSEKGGKIREFIRKFS